MLEFAIVLLLKRNPKVPKMITCPEDQSNHIGKRKDNNALAAYILIDLIGSFIKY